MTGRIIPSAAFLVGLTAITAARLRRRPFTAPMSACRRDVLRDRGSHCVPHPTLARRGWVSPRAWVLAPRALGCAPAHLRTAVARLIA